MNNTCGILQFHTENRCKVWEPLLFPHPGGFDGDSPPWLGSVKLKITTDPLIQRTHMSFPNHWVAVFQGFTYEKMGLKYFFFLNITHVLDMKD